MTEKTPLYNVYKDGELIYTQGTFAVCTRVMADIMGDPTGIVLVAEAVKAGFQLQALA